MYLDGIFDLIDIIKNKFRKKSLEQELDEYLEAETPGELNKIVKEIPRGIYTEEQFNNLRKDL